MDFTQFLGAIPAALIPVALVLYFTDQNTKNWMSERREITLAILNERKEWLTERQLVLERQFSMQDRTITEIASTKVEIANFKAEDHAVRNVLQQLTSKIEAMSLHIQSQGKGGSS